MGIVLDTNKQLHVSRPSTLRVMSTFSLFFGLNRQVFRTPLGHGLAIKHSLLKNIYEENQDLNYSPENLHPFALQQS
jgi:hypothetical protein